MGRPNRRGMRPGLERIEGRVLPSAITAVLAGTSRYVAAQDYASSIQLGSRTLTQGPVLNGDGTINNMALAPTGRPKPGELRRQQFSAHFSGPYRIVPGRTTTQAAQVLIQGGGTSSTMLHSDIQIRIVQPKDAGLPFGGAGTVFDRNINSNSALGFDISAPQDRAAVDRHGRPIRFPSVSIDVNSSAGTYVEAYGQGTLTIRYLPGRQRTPGVISQGTAIVTMHMQIYAPATSYLLRNVGLNP